MKRKWLSFFGAREGVGRNSFAFLVWHFFQRFFAGEIFSGEGDLRVGIGGIAALLALPGAILPLLLLPKYSSFLRWLTGVRHFDYSRASIPDKYTLLTLTMAITGIVAVLKWDSLFPDRLDYANLTQLPINTRRVFLAKFIALMLFAGLFILALNAASTFVFPYVVMGDQTRADLWARFMAAHAVATVAGSAFMFFSFLALAGILMTVLPYRRFRQISKIVQFVSVISLVMLLFSTPEIGALMANAAGNAHAFVRWLPTVWFLGLYQSISSARADVEFHALAARAIAGLVTAVGTSLLFYMASYGRFFRRIPEVVETDVNGPGRVREFAGNCLDYLAPQAAFDRACFHFAAKTLARSQRHALFLAGFAGLGVAVAIQDATTGWGETLHGAVRMPSATTLSAALAIVFFLLTGLVFVFGVPAELHANWVFQAISERKSGVAQRVARKLMSIFLVPVIIGAALVYSIFWGVWAGIAHTAFVLLASLLMVEVLLAGYRKIPFTCSYSSGKYNIGSVLAAYFIGFLFFSPGLASVERWALSLPSCIAFLALLALLAAAWIGIRSYGREMRGENEPLIFTDERECVVASMDLR